MALKGEDDRGKLILTKLDLVQSGIQWRRVKSNSVSYVTIHKHAMKWFNANAIKDAYTVVLRCIEDVGVFTRLNTIALILR